MIRIRSKTDADDGLDMTPLIDCVFNLLLFFVLAASFTIRGMSLDLPPAKETRSITGRIVEVRLFENGTYSVDDILALEDLPAVPGGKSRAASLNYVPLEYWAELSVQRAGGKGGTK